MEAPPPERLNEDIAGRLDEVAQILATQGASRFRVRAYQRAAETVRRVSRPVSDILAQEGLEGLQALPGVGESIARAIRDILARGRLAMLERLRGESDPAKLLASVPGIGRATADRLHQEPGLETLEDLKRPPLPRASIESCPARQSSRLLGIKVRRAHTTRRSLRIGHDAKGHERTGRFLTKHGRASLLDWIVSGQDGRPIDIRADGAFRPIEGFERSNI